MSFRRCLMILADGARADVFGELLAAGKLPHIARHIVQRGSFREAVTAFPSTTGPAYMPFLTGCLPSTCNVPGIRWFDKSAFRNGKKKRRMRSYVGIETFHINNDMRPEIATLFSLFPKSYSVFNSVCRGVAHNRTRIMRIWYWYYAHLTDRWGFVDERATDFLLDMIKRDFQFGFIVFPGIDEYAHICDPRHPRVIEAYSAVDKAVGLAAERLKRLGRYDETMLFLVSDHGLTQTHTHFCLNRFLEARGLRTLFYPLVFKRDCVAANMMSGNGMSHLYFRHQDGWGEAMNYAAIEALSPGIHDALLNEPAVDIIATRDGAESIVIGSRRGKARLTWHGDEFDYQPESGDPFGFVGLVGRFDADSQYQRTAASNYPDGIYQLAHIFMSPRAGDVVVSATTGFDLRDRYEYPEHKSSHGSLCRDHMIVPVASSVRLGDRLLRTIDIFPTVLNAMGRAIPANIDGRNALAKGDV